MRGPFWVAIPAGRTASCTSCGGAARTASQVGKRSRRRSKARYWLASVVLWESTVVTSSDTGGCRRPQGRGP